MLAAPLWGLIDGSGHLGQYQIGRLPWQFALGRAKEWPRVIEPHFVRAFANRLRFAGAASGTDRSTSPSPHWKAGTSASTMSISLRRVLPRWSLTVLVKPSIEVGIIGREGMTGLAIVMGQQRASHDTYVQVAGKGQRIKSSQVA